MTVAKASPTFAHVGRMVLTVVAALFFGVGWLAALVTALIVAAARSVSGSWPAAAVRVGWRDARRVIQRRPN